MTREEAEDIAQAAAHAAVIETLKTLGVDTSNPFEMQRDFAHLRSWRQSVESVQRKSILTIAGIITAGILGAIWMAIKGH